MSLESIPVESTAVRLGAADASVTMQAALRSRSSILAMTQQAEQAVLNPDEPGAWPATLRCALAARIAAVNELPELKKHYLDRVSTHKFAALGELDCDGAELGLTLVVAYTDRVASQPRNIRPEDIRLLQEGGVTDADIVRLTELNAFMAYQVRLVSGLQLMGAGDNELDDI